MDMRRGREESTTQEWPEAMAEVLADLMSEQGEAREDARNEMPNHGMEENRGGLDRTGNAIFYLHVQHGVDEATITGSAGTEESPTRRP
jgi:hypothetical protein